MAGTASKAAFGLTRDAVSGGLRLPMMRLPRDSLLAYVWHRMICVMTPVVTSPSGIPRSGRLQVHEKGGNV